MFDVKTPILLILLNFLILYLCHWEVVYYYYYFVVVVVIIIIIIIDIGVERTTPLLGVNDGRNKRDLARARKVRKPTTRGQKGGERGGGPTLLTGQSGDEVVSNK